MNADVTTALADVSDMDEAIILLGNAADGFVRKRADTKTLRRMRQHLPGHDPTVWQEMAELGWFGVLVPEPLGGSGLGFRALSKVVERLGHDLLAGPFVAAVVLAGQVLRHAPAGRVRDGLLDRLIGGDILTLAWQEESGSLDVLPVQTTARRDDYGWRLSGRKRFVVGAGGTTGYLVTALLNGEPGVFFVAAGTSGLVETQSYAADGSPSTSLSLDNVQVADEHLLAQGDPARLALDRARDEAAIMASVELIGLSKAALAMTLDYMRTRVQYDKPIGSYQALQHMSVDLFVQQSLAEAVANEAAEALDGGIEAGPLRVLAGRIKARCSDAALKITRGAVQLHGAIGVTDEYDAGLYLKRALVLSAWLGNSAQHRQRFAATMMSANRPSDGRAESDEV